MSARTITARAAAWSLGLAAVLLAEAGPAAAAIRYLSYEPADDATRAAAGPLTFTLRQRLVGATVLQVRSTEAPAMAELKPAPAGALGPGGLERLVGRAGGKDLYEVEPLLQGPEMIRALCPGSTRAWLAFGHVSTTEPLRIAVLGDAPAGGPARLCRTLAFDFHGEWRLPPPRGVPFRDLKQPHEGPLGG